MVIYFRHDKVRPFQRELMNDIYDALSQRSIIMTNAATGSGKTDASLSAAITHALDEQLNVFFLTPKISQHKIALEVAKGIAEKHSLKFRAVDLVGRANCCIDHNLMNLDYDAFHTLCAKKRKNKECVFFSNARGFDRRGEYKADELFKRVLEDYGVARSHHEMIRLGAKRGACPYEWLLKLGENSDVIIADYHHLMNPHIRDVFLNKVKKRIEDSIIVIDEAHNLAQRVRDSLSSRISTFTLMQMEKEMRFLGLDAGPVSQEFEKWAANMMADEKEHVIAAKSFELFIDQFGLTMEEAANNMMEAGFKFVEAGRNG